MIYRFEAYGYSDFEVEILHHEEIFSNNEMVSILEKAKNIVRNENKPGFNYFDSLLNVLIDEFGFSRVYTIDVDVGSNCDSKVRVWDRPENLSFVVKKEEKYE